MAFIIKWNLSIGIVAFMAYVVQKIMGKRLGHYWRKIVWILLTLKMCFPFWSVTEKFRQHPFMISMPAYYIGEQNQKTAIMTKMGNVSIRRWMSGEKFLLYIWIAGMILCLLFHAIQYRIWKKRIFAECKKMQKNSVLEALKKASEVCKIKKTINEQISNFAQTYPTNLKASSNEALLFMRRYRFANCSCFSCCFKDAYPSSNVQ